MSTDYLRYILSMLSMCHYRDISLFSKEFIWNDENRKIRFEKVIYKISKYRLHMSILEMVLRSGLSNEERQLMFPTLLDLGRTELLEPQQRTYESIANNVVNQLNIDSMELDERYVKQTAVSLAKLVGFSFGDYRSVNPDLAARVLNLLVYMKKTQGPFILNMLQSPEGKRRPSLELTNPYDQGVKNERRLIFSDLKNYVSVQIPLNRLNEIDDCFARLRPELGEFYGLVMRKAQNAYNQYKKSPTIEEFCTRLNHAQKIYAEKFNKINELKRVFLPLDEQLYIHMCSLEYLHYSEFMKLISQKKLIRDEIRPALIKYQLTQRKEVSYQDLKDNPDHFLELLPVVEYAFNQNITAQKFLQAVSQASDVLRHYTLVRDLNEKKLLDYSWVTAAICFAIDLNSSPSPQYKPHMYGQQNISGSILAAVRGEISERHEEFERIISESVEWYKAALSNQIETHSACHDFMDFFNQFVIKLCKSHDTKSIIEFLDKLKEPKFESIWINQTFTKYSSFKEMFK